MDKKVGKITEDEMNEVEVLFEKKIALENLTKILDPVINESLYEKTVRDYGETIHAFNNWWADKSEQYNWERNDKEWYVDFNTGDIYLRQ